MGDGFLAQLTELIEENLRVNNFEAERAELGDDADSAQWILQDPDTGYHWTIEVTGV